MAVFVDGLGQKGVEIRDLSARIRKVKYAGLQTIADISNIDGQSPVDLMAYLL